MNNISKTSNTQTRTNKQNKTKHRQSKRSTSEGHESDSTDDTTNNTTNAASTQNESADARQYERHHEPQHATKFATRHATQHVILHAQQHSAATKQTHQQIRKRIKQNKTNIPTGATSSASTRRITNQTTLTQWSKWQYSHRQLIPSQIYQHSDRPNQPSDQRQQPLDDFFVLTPKDNFPIGDPISICEPNSNRFYFQNVNGLGSAQHKWPWILQQMGEHEVSIFGLAETNVHWTKTIYDKCKKDMQAISKFSSLTTSSSTITPLKGVYQPGGTALAVLGKWTGRCVNVDKDPTGMGRWTQTTIQGKEGASLAVYTAYRVNDGTGTAGIHTAWSQQELLLREAGKRQVDPRQALLKDLGLVLQETTARRQGIVLMMDANEAYLNHRNKPTNIAEWAIANGLVDVHYYFHPDDSQTATYSRGSTKIDYIFVSRDVLPYITAAGMLAFNQLIQSDHRGLFVDIDIIKYLQGDVTSMESVAARKLNSKRPRDVKHYQTKLTQALELMRAHERLDEIESERAESTLSAWWGKLVELDNEISQAMEATEASIKQKKYPFSDQLLQANIRWIYWSTAKTAKLTGRDMQFRLAQWAAKLKTNRPNPQAPTTLTQIRSSLQQAARDLRQVKRDASNLRKQFLQERAQAAALEGNDTAERALVKIMAAERSKETFAAIKRYMTGNRKMGLTHLLIPKGMAPEEYPYNPEEVTEWDVIQDETDIGQYLRARNIAHFGQAQGTPFTVEPLQSAINPAADTSQVDQILNGILPHSFANVSEATKDFLAECKRKAPELDFRLDLDTCKASFRHWRESTATCGPRHLGHYRALFAPNGIDTAAETEESMGDRIMRLHVRIMNMAIYKGEPLPRWLQALNIILPKIPGKPFLHKLRIIHLFQADYQLILKELAYRLNRHTETRELLGDQQYGSRPGRSSTRLLLATTLIKDSANSMRENMATANKDAQACYDRMIGSSVGLVDRTFGCPITVCQLHGKALDRMEYRIKTAAGIAESTRYTNTREKPLYGNGQGACDSPMQWGFVSIIMANIMKAKAHGLTMTDPTGRLKVKRTIQLFVDDSDIFTNGERKDIPAIELLERLRADSQRWANLLHISGGRLELTKCFFNVVIWKFDEWGKPSPMKVSDLGNPQTRLTQGDEFADLNIQECTKGYKTLGQYHALVGVPCEERQRLQAKAGHYIKKLFNHGLTRDQALVAYHQAYTPGMTYAIGTTPLFPRDLQEIQAPATTAFLPALGLNRHMPRALIYGPVDFGGMGLTDLSVEAGVEATAQAITHLRDSNSVEGTMLRIALRNRQMEAGTRRLLLEEPTQQIPYLAPGWIPNLRNFLASIDHSLQIPSETEQPLPREGDFYIMDEITRHTTNPTRLERINACRLYLQVTFLSEISTTDGEKLDDSYLYETATPRKNRLNWPQQQKPGRKGWALYRKAITTVFAKPHYTGRNRELRQPLGNWLIPVQELAQQWETVIDPDNACLYQRIGSEWAAHPQIPVVSHTRRSIRTNFPGQWFSEHSTGTSHNIPSNCVPTTVHFRGHHFATPVPSKLIPPSTAENYSSFTQYLRDFPSWDKELRQYTNIYWTDHEFATKLRQNINLIQCSDGGVKDGLGSFGWILAVQDTEEIIAQSKGPAHGDSEMMHSFRAEGYGGISATQFLTHAVTYFNIPRHERVFQCKWICDNLGLIKRLQRLQSKIPSTGLNLKTDSDVCQQLLHTIMEIPNHRMQHVKGHQDKPGVRLTFEARLNVSADSQATQYYNEVLQPSKLSNIDAAYTKAESIPRMPHCGAQLINLHNKLHPRAITSRIRDHLRNAALTPDLREYMINKHGWDATTPDLINWNAYAKARKKLQWSQFAKVAKLSNGWAATAAFLHKQNPDETDKCCKCNRVEDANHVLTCTSRHKAQVQYLVKMHTILTTYRVHHHIESSIMQGIRRFLGFPPEPDHWASDQIQEAYNTQTSIGWDRFVFGYIGSDWMDIQTRHEQTLPALQHERKPEQWVVQLIQLGWEFIGEAWTLRNDDKHGRDAAKERLMQASLHAQIVTAYDKKDRLTVQSQRFFAKTIEEKGAEAPHEIKSWLRHVTRLIRAEETTEIQRNKDGNQDIRSFFKPREGVG